MMLPGWEILLIAVVAIVISVSLLIGAAMLLIKHIIDLWAAGQE